MAGFGSFYKGEKKKKKKTGGGKPVGLAPIFTPPTIHKKGKDNE